MDKNSLVKWAFEQLRPPVVDSIDRWAEKTVVLPPAVSSSPGPLSLDWTPYLRKPLQDASDSEVNEITLCFSTQVGKTLTAILIVLHSLAVRKRPALYCMPTADEAVAICEERFQHLINASPGLKALLDPHRKKSMKRDSLCLDGIVANFVGARSPSKLASRAKGTVIADETDKYPDWSGKEADPLKLARERMRTYHDRKMLNISTPTTNKKYIWPALLKSSYEKFHLPCPSCKKYQALIFGDREEGTGGIKWPSGTRDPDKILDGNLAYYSCKYCAAKINDTDKQSMLRRGVWVPEGMEFVDGELKGKAPSRRNIGFHLWAAYSPWLTFSEIAAEYLKCFRNERAVPKDLMNFVNSWLAEPWEETTAELSAPSVRNCVQPYNQGVVPSGCDILVATCDVQATMNRAYLYYDITGYGSEGRSYKIKVGRVDGWESLHTLLFNSDFSREDGQRIPIRFAAIDSGFKTDEVYGFCLKTGAWAIKGSQSAKIHHKPTQIECSGQAVNLLHIDTTYYKDKLHRLIKEGEQWFLPMDLPEEFFDHLCAEQKVQEVDKRSGRVKFVWKCVPEGSPNHLFDCSVYQLAVSDLLQLENRQREEKEKQPRKETSPIKAQRIFS